MDSGRYNFDRYCQISNSESVEQNEDKVLKLTIFET